MNDPHEPRATTPTGETGDLTPPERDDEFVPGERRIVEDDAAHLAVTGAMRRESAQHHAATANAPGTHASDAPNDRDGGYGSEHGLQGDDPAYRMDEPLMPARQGPPSEAGDETPSEERIDPADDRY